MGEIWISYQRVSDPRQEKEGHSIPAQLEINRDYAARHGQRLVREFIEKKSAWKSGFRPEFNALLEFLNNEKKPVHLVAEKTDRLYRNWEEFGLIQRLVKDHRLTVHFSKECTTLRADAPPNDHLHHMHNMVYSSYYPLHLSHEIRKGQRQKVLKGGWPHQPPPGYKNRKEDRQIIPDPDLVPFVVRAFELYASGAYSLRAVSDRLYNEGFIYRPNRPKMPKNHLAKMLRNPFYIGKMLWKGNLYEGNHDPIVPPQIWDMAQKAARKDGKPTTYNKHSFKYGQMIRCAECGSQVVGEVKKGKYVYYRCGLNKRGCIQGYVSEAVLDAQIETLIRSVVIPPDLQRAIRESVKDFNRLQANTVREERRRITTQINRRQTQKRQAYQDRLDGIIDGDTYRGLAEDFDAQIRALDDQLAQVTQSDIDFDQLSEMWVELPQLLSRKWPQASADQKKTILLLLGSNFTIQGKELRYSVNEPFASIAENERLLNMVEPKGRISNFMAYLQRHARVIESAARALAA